MNAIKFICLVLGCCSAFTTFSRDIYVVHPQNDVPQEVQGKVIFRSIQKAIDDSQPNDIIYILNGEYFETLSFKNKSELTCTVYKDHEVTINGSRKIDIKNNAFSLRTSEFKSENIKSRKDNYPFVYDEDDIPLWIYSNRANLNREYLSIKNMPSCILENETLYFKNTDSDKAYYFSRQQHVVSIVNCENLTIDGKNALTIKNGSRRNVLITGMKPSENTTIAVKNCTIVNSKIGITAANVSNKVEISGNQLYSNADPDLTWNEIKNCHLFNPNAKCISYFESVGILVSGKSNDSKLYSNDVSGYFNGIVVLGNNAEITSNKIHRIKDDGIEIEGDAENILVLDNQIIDCYRSISMAPVKNGPVYISDNYIIQSQRDFPTKLDERRKLQYSESRPFKFWSQPKNGKLIQSKNVYILNNTIYSQATAPLIGGRRRELSPFHSYFQNNIFISSNEQIALDNLDASVQFDNNLFISEGRDTGYKTKQNNVYMGCERLSSLDAKDLQLSEKTRKRLDSSLKGQKRSTLSNLPEKVVIGKYPGKING